MKKIKLPKFLYICGKKYKIKLTKVCGGSYDINDRVIEISLLYPNDAFEILIHEVVEIIFHERGHRYSKYIEEENDEYLFVVKHCELENITNDLAVVMEQLVKQKEG